MQTIDNESSTAHVDHVADEARVLADDEVRLSGDRIARVRHTNALHDHRSDMLVVAAGFDKGGVINIPVHTRFRALLAVAAIDGRPLRWPRGRRADMESFLTQFDSGDCERLAAAYEALNDSLTPQTATTTGAGEE